MTKKGRQKFRRMKIGKLFLEKEKRSNWGNFPRSPKFVSGIGGNVKQGGQCITASGGIDAPECWNSVTKKSIFTANSIFHSYF